MRRVVSRRFFHRNPQRRVLWPVALALGGISAAFAVDVDQLQRGEELYRGPGSCVVCHLPDGAGQPGSVPPLAGSDWLKGNPDRAVAIALRGLIGPVKVNGRRYYSAMPPQSLLDDAALASVLTYVNNAWGNDGPVITADRVAKARAELPPDIYTPETILQAFPLAKALRKRNGTFKPDFDDALINVTEPVVYRTFMPGASPAAFAVALPGNQYYCWDAGECRLRYAWTKGGFIRGNRVHWSSNGKPIAQFFGDPYYRARSRLLQSEDYAHLAETDRKRPFYDTSQADDFPVRIDALEARPRYRGYRLIEGHPEFRYTLGEFEIRELIRTSPDQLGIVRFFAIDPATPITFRLTPTELARITSSVGRIAADGSLKLNAQQARRFSITIIEKNPAPKTLIGDFE